MKPTCGWIVDARGSRCGNDASTRLTTKLKVHDYHQRMDRWKDKVVTSYLCAVHSDRSPEYDFGTLRRSKRSLA